MASPKVLNPHSGNGSLSMSDLTATSELELLRQTLRSEKRTRERSEQELRRVQLELERVESLMQREMENRKVLEESLAVERTAREQIESTRSKFSLSVSELQIEKSKLKQQYDAAVSQLAEIREQIVREKHEHAVALKNTKREADEMLEHEKHMIESHLRASNESRNSAFSQLQSQVQAGKEQLQFIQSQMEETKQTYQFQIEKLQKENHQLQLALKGAETESEGQLQSQQAQISYLQTQLQTAQDHKEHISDQTIHLQQQLRGSNEKCAHLQGLLDETRQEMQTQVDSAQERNTMLQDQMTEMRTHYNTQLATLQERLNQIQGDSRSEHEKVSSLQSQVRNLSEELKTARAAKEVAQQQLSQSKADTVLLRDRCQRLEEERAIMETNVTKAEQELKAEKKAAEILLGEYQIRIHELNTQVTSLTKTVEQLRFEKQSKSEAAEGEIARLTERAKELEHRVVHMQETHSHKLEALTADNEQYRTMNAQLRDELRSITQNHAAAMQEHQRLLANLNDDLDRQMQMSEQQQRDEERKRFAAEESAAEAREASTRTAHQLTFAQQRLSEMDLALAQSEQRHNHLGRDYEELRDELQQSDRRARMQYEQLRVEKETEIRSLQTLLAQWKRAALAIEEDSKYLIHDRSPMRRSPSRHTEY